MRMILGGISDMSARPLLALLVVMGLAGPALAEKRVALVVGNSGYQNVAPLENPAHDAVLVAQTLKELGFSLTGDAAQLNLDKRALDEAVQAFGRQVQGADVAMFYYAGHGVQLRGANYLVPVGANPTREADVDFQMVDINVVLNQMQGSGTRLNMIILDACRNNPFGGRSLRAAGGGLAQLRAPDGTLISYATQPGNVAQDGDDGHSPYTRALAATMKRPGLDLFQTFNEVGLIVKRATGGAQQPWVSSSPIDGSFYFSGAPQAPSIGAVSHQDEAPAEAMRQEARLAVPTASLPAADGSVTDCDRLAANPTDAQRAKSVKGVRITDIQIVPALAACNQAMQQYPDVARFVFQAGRVAQAQKDYVLARQLYEKAASMNHAASYINLGALYYQGNGAPKDYDAARTWYEKAVAANDAVGFNAIGYLYEQGNGEPKDYAQARAWYEKAIAAGVPLASANLGRLYMDGNGVPKDLARAKGLFETAANAGEPSGMRSLGVLYDRGLGVAPDPLQARQWYEKGAAGGDATAMNNLGWLYEQGKGVTKDYGEARKWYEKASAAGVKIATVSLGRLYQEGSGVPMNPGRARSLYEQVANAGDAGGMRSLGFLYDRGIGVPQDPVQARQWYEKAIALGDATAMNNLGGLYEQGRGVAKDLGQAKTWYEKAAGLGQLVAMTNLGNLYRDGRGVQKDYTQARAWFEKAAAGGRTYAMMQLGDFYRQGFGVTRDSARARKWYEMAQAGGDTAAAKAISDLDGGKKK
jgi:TPR repeat protein